jgi:hypothetical protein
MPEISGELGAEAEDTSVTLRVTGVSGELGAEAEDTSVTLRVTGDSGGDCSLFSIFDILFLRMHYL